MKWTKRDRETEGEREIAGKELMQMERAGKKKVEGRLNVNLLLTITFYCSGCETLQLFVL